MPDLNKGYKTYRKIGIRIRYPKYPAKNSCVKSASA
jgi:hypothetical protein